MFLQFKSIVIKLAQKKFSCNIGAMIWQLAVLYQIIVTAEGPTFELYAKNMGSLMLEKLRNADMIIINRCDQALRDALRRRNLRMVNRRADIYLENTDGTSEDYMDGTVSAFTMPLARSTAPYQRLAPASTDTSPTTTAVSATRAAGSI